MSQTVFERRNNAGGYSLMEVMIAVVIVALLAAMVYPTYLKNSRSAKRADARALLLEDAQYMERVFTESNSYMPLNASGVATTPTLPTIIAPKNTSGTTTNYDISFAASSVTATGFTLQAVPKNAMSSDPCKTLTYNNLGQKGTSGTLDDGMTTQTCWSK